MIGYITERSGFVLWGGQILLGTRQHTHKHTVAMGCPCAITIFHFCISPYCWWHFVCVLFSTRVAPKVYSVWRVCSWNGYLYRLLAGLLSLFEDKSLCLIFDTVCLGHQLQKKLPNRFILCVYTRSHTHTHNP